MYSHKMPLYKYILDEDLLRNALVKLLGTFKRNIGGETQHCKQKLKSFFIK
jgi:hypothetical protein